MKFFNKKPYLIAEIGVNHNGSLPLALKSIEQAAKSGADAVKFQMFNTEEFMSDKKINYKYKTKKGFKSENMFKMFKRLEFSDKWLKKILYTCKKHKVDFLSSVADIKTADLVNRLKVKAIKLSSEDLINYPLVEYVASLRRKTILSTGMADENEIKRAIGYFKKFKTPFILLHCVSVYPTPDEETNLLRMVSLSKKFKTQVGFSDHTIGIQASIAAVILGAAVIEKHFTLSKNLVGPDHQLSMDPKEFKSLHDNVKKAQIILGNKSILPSKTEKKTKKIFRRSVTALKNIKKGEKYSKYNICLKRPANGLHPKYLNFLLGKKAKINIKINSKIQKKHLI